MGRPRSNYICPKCGKQGYKEKNATRNGNYPNSKYRKYWRVVHYDSFTKKKSFCHVNHIILKNEERIHEYKKKLEQLAITSPTEFQEHILKKEQNNKLIRNNMKEEKIIEKLIVKEYNIDLG